MRDKYLGKIVEIHRYFNLVEMSQSDPEVKAWLGQSFRAIGPYFKDRATATGLSFEEQRVLLPELLGIEATDKDFRKTVNKFYDEFITSVGKDGIKLKISLQDDNAPLSEFNKPLYLNDYIKYRHIYGHPDVAKDKVEAERLYNKRFYIVDPDRVSIEAISLNALEDKAMSVYFKHKEDKIKIDQILVMLGINISAMKHEDKVLKLKSYSTKTPSYNEVEQKESFDRFIKVAEDKDLEYKYLIQEMIAIQYLRRAGNNIVYEETGNSLGENMEDAVLALKNPKNSRNLNLMKAQYLNKIKNGSVEYLPKEDKQEVKE